ncbi:hypothetical protein pb186bvf_000377 [Paramecium bursaria]
MAKINSNTRKKLIKEIFHTINKFIKLINVNNSSDDKTCLTFVFYQSLTSSYYKHVIYQISREKQIYKENKILREKE